MLVYKQSSLKTLRYPFLKDSNYLQTLIVHVCPICMVVIETYGINIWEEMDWKLRHNDFPDTRVATAKFP